MSGSVVGASGKSLSLTSGHGQIRLTPEQHLQIVNTVKPDAFQVIADEVRCVLSRLLLARMLTAAKFFYFLWFPGDVFVL